MFCPEGRALNFMPKKIVCMISQTVFSGEKNKKKKYQNSRPLGENPFKLVLLSFEKGAILKGKKLLPLRNIKDRNLLPNSSRLE